MFRQQSVILMGFITKEYKIITSSCKVKRSKIKIPKHKFHTHGLQYCDVKITVTPGVFSCLWSRGLCTQASASLKYGSHPVTVTVLPLLIFQHRSIVSH